MVVDGGDGGLKACFDPCPEEEEQEKKDNPENINTNPSPPPDPSISFIMEKVCKLNSFLESSGLVPQSFDTKIVCTKGDDGDVMFIEIFRKNDDSHEEGPEDEGCVMIEGLEVEYFDTFLTRSEVAYHRNDEDKRRGVEYVISKILGFYKEGLGIGPEYLTGVADDEVT
uniref:Serpin n=1 Tax=Tanacetum cinerariifolium TaxID=118510 RepID=A0A6L2KCX5_TANCI|nr:serpin [Tanacetum cinerariifolium]